MKLPKVYEAKDYESDIYKLWEDSGAFQPADKGNPFSIVLPPPNATGKLHLGHSAMIAIEDTICRYRRMKGDSVLWIPGTDHAAIATESVVLKRLMADGIEDPKEELGREKVLEEIQDFVTDSRDTIRNQIRSMGASVDWTRERYTMEASMNRIVNEVFIKMHDDGLIYRGHRIVNWDTVLQTVVSDDEVDYKEATDTLYTFKYGPFEIATARPETKFGDKYVVMHPDDKRYHKYKHGEKVDVEWINGKVEATIIKDEAIDPEFGTGVMTITPWHDVVDFEIAQRHDLDVQQIIDLNGNLLKVAGEFEGMHIDEARPKIVEKMKEKGLLVSEDPDYVHNIAISDRGKAKVEPQILEQWFIDVNKAVIKWKGKKHSFKEIMQSVVRDGDIEIVPKRFEKIYFNWIDNLRDWCVSRQIWWGHRIPAWYRDTEDGFETKVQLEKPDGDDWEQDGDTLDTWFSSGNWTWATMIPPEVAENPKFDLAKMLKESPDFKKFHPTTLMETGYDIIFFWVARMILMTTYATGEIPFKTVYLHGMVRDREGRKMSKSIPETNIDPLDVIPKYGTDALRLSLIVGQSPGADMKLYEEKIAGYRNFCNKLWNIARYVEGAIGDDYSRHNPKTKFAADHWILSKLSTLAKEVDEDLERYQLSQAYEKVYHFIWDDFADWYIETSKTQFNPDMLVYVLENILRITHPFAPFVTETIWDTLQWEDDLLMSAKWPEVKAGDKKQADHFEQIQAIVKEIRNLRTSLSLTNNVLYHKDSDFLMENKDLLLRLTKLQDVRKVSSGKGLHLTQTNEEAWIDVEEQKAQVYLMNLLKKKKAAQASINTMKSRLDNKGYMKNAPAELVNETKAKLAEEESLIEKLNKEIDTFEHSLKSI